MIIEEALSPEAFAQKARRIAERLSHDPEAAHDEADDLMEEQLCLLGFQEGVSVVRALTRWYA